MGIAFSDYHGTYAAGVAEVSVDKATGKIKVHNYWVAVDPGLVIQPDHVHGQLESAVVYGLSAALLEELTVKGGAIQQSNFNDYPVLRMSDLPEIHTKIVATNNPPEGMGEIGVVHVAPAIGNAHLPAHRQAASRAADVARPGEEGAGVTPALTQPCPPRSAGNAAGFFLATGKRVAAGISWLKHKELSMDDKTQTELEAAVYRRLVEHLRGRTDVQNIDMMNLAGFCRNCLSNWMKDAADAKGVPMTKDQSREIVYGEPFEQWKAKHQKEASPEKKAAFEKPRRISTEISDAGAAKLCDFRGPTGRHLLR